MDQLAHVPIKEVQDGQGRNCRSGFVSDGCYTPCSGGGWQVGLFPDFLSRTIWEGAHYNLTYGSPAEQRQEKGVKVEKAWILFFSYSLGFGTVGKGPEILVCSLERQGQLLTMVTV